MKKRAYQIVLLTYEYDDKFKNETQSFAENYIYENYEDAKDTLMNFVESVIFQLKEINKDKKKENDDLHSR